VLGLTRGTGRPQFVRAVLEGVAHRGADLLDAAEADAGLSVPALRVDGGMAANPVFTGALADACARPVEVSPALEATTLGAAFLAGLAVGTWRGWDDVAAAWSPAVVVEPAHTLDRDRWREAKARAAAWIPDLSALDF
jgi:glycerol kinase